MIDLAPGVSAPLSALRLAYARSGGPGGQNVNKLNTKAELWLALPAVVGMPPGAVTRLRTLAGRRITRGDELHLTAQTERTQERNRETVLARLRELIAQAMIAPTPRRRTKPSRAAKKRRLEAKRRRGEIKSGRRESPEW
jgi:ribosome-associated protein